LVEYKRANPNPPGIEDSAEADIQAAVVSRLETDRDAVVLHEAIWILDSMFFPVYGIQPRLESFVADASADSALRFRAISAFGRLVASKRSAIDRHDILFIAASIGSDDLWVRAAAAFICEILPEGGLDPDGKRTLREALEGAWSREGQFTPGLHCPRTRSVRWVAHKAL
jgi:hypothetical protein